MNWDIFLMFLFVIALTECISGVIMGAVEAEKETHYRHYHAVGFLFFLTVLVLMWFWT